MSTTPLTATTSAFALDGVSVRFGGLVALADVSLTVAPHRVHGVIGPNGAGKTTLFNVACGFVRPESGRILRHGEPLPRLRPHDLAGLGIARTLQGLGLFERMTVLDNVMVGADRHARSGFWSTALALPRSWREERALRARALEALDALGVADLAALPPASLPYPLYAFVQALQGIGEDPTREALVEFMEEEAGSLEGPELAPFRYGTDSHLGISGMRVIELKGDGSEPLTPVLVTDVGDTEISEDDSGQADDAPPESGIPE